MFVNAVRDGVVEENPDMDIFVYDLPEIVRSFRFFFSVVFTHTVSHHLTKLSLGSRNDEDFLEASFFFFCTMGGGDLPCFLTPPGPIV